MKNKLTKQKTPSKLQISHLVNKLKAGLALHGIFIMLMVAGGGIGFALFRSTSYLSPMRDETKYQELSSGTSYSKIDYELVTKLQEALSDTDVTVNQKLAPNRNNPFSE